MAQPYTEQLDAVVIGSGPAGLIAAEMLVRAGRRVVVAEAMPSVGRKFLMAGKSGLNLTKEEPASAFVARFGPVPGVMRDALGAFGPKEVRGFAEGLGQAVFTGSTGRVFPVAMKASPMLRAWMERLGDLGVEVRTRWRWLGWEGDVTVFATPEGVRRVMAGVTVLALGGASWRRLGSDGVWADVFGAEGLATEVFRPANMGFVVNWSAHMARFFGVPVKGTALRAGGLESRGEWVISKSGVEGGGVYEVSAAVRDGAALIVDLMPDVAAADLAGRLAKGGRQSLANRLRRAGVSDVGRALLMEFGRPLPADADGLARLIKALELRHDVPRDMDQAISVAGGVNWEALDGSLMLKARPGVFCAGEMLDWEAPTGGYLLTGCMATGRAAGRGAVSWLERR